MVWPDGGLQHSDGAGNLVFASHLNTKAMQERGNKVIDGCIVTEQSPTPDLTVEVASGNVIANGVVVAVSASDPFAGTPATFATTQGLLTSGQAEFVAVHVDSSGVITNTEGGAASAGQQTPPEVPEDEVLLAMITLTFGDSTINTATDIEDWRQFVPDGQYIAGNGEITGTFDISGHDLASIGLKLAGTLVTSSAAELNVLDGVTAFSGTPSDIANSSSAGSSTIIPRLDHVHAHPSGLTSNLHHTKYALTEDLTSGEITQLKNINSVTIINDQWGYLGALTEDVQTFLDSFGTITNTPSIDQSLLTSSTPYFAGLGIGVTPAELFHIKTTINTDRLLFELDADGGTSLLTQTHSGILLTAKTMSTTLEVTPALMFGSTDADFTTTNPKVLAGILGVATEDYDGDTASGMDLYFFATPNNDGATPTPDLVMWCAGDGNLYTNNNLIIGNASRIEPATDITSSNEVGSSSKRWGKMWLDPTPQASGSALVITAGGQIIKTNSSRRGKENFAKFDLPPSILYDFPKPLFYNFKGQNDVKAFGYIAEDIEKILPEVIHYDESGLADSIDYPRLTVMLIEEYKMMKKELIELKQRI